MKFYQQRQKGRKQCLHLPPDILLYSAYRVSLADLLQAQAPDRAVISDPFPPQNGINDTHGLFFIQMDHVSVAQLYIKTRCQTAALRGPQRRRLPARRER